MNELAHPLHHLFHFDGVLHWCFLIALFGFALGIVWMIVRILIPLRRLANQAESIMTGALPTFDVSGGIREIDQLRRSLQYMVEQIASAQARELMYRAALTESQENERKRIAREIHDDTIQSLVLAAHSIERAAQERADAGRSHLENARQQVIQTVDNLRQMIADLRPTVLDELGLAAAIETLCDKYPRLVFSVMGDPYSIDHAQELAIFRAAQEAICNAERHANARRITATLTYSPDSVRLEVRDDGHGFHVPKHLNEFALTGHYGLIGIRERIQHLGGTVKVESRLSAGTYLTVTVPAKPLDLRVA